MKHHRPSAQGLSPHWSLFPMAENCYFSPAIFGVDRNVHEGHNQKLELSDLPSRAGYGHGVCLSRAPQMVGMVPEMVWVGDFSNLHTLRQRPWGTFPGHLIVGNPFLKDFHAQAIRRITKLFIFPPTIRKDVAGSRENPAILLVIIWGHTQTTGCAFTKGFFCFHGQQFTFQVLPKALYHAALGRIYHTY